MEKREIGKRLKGLREENGYTQKELAKVLNIKNPSTIGSWEIGKSEPNLNTFSQLCAIYNISDIHAIIPADNFIPDNKVPDKEFRLIDALLYEKIGRFPSRKETEMTNNILDGMCKLLIRS